ncbi:MAG: hypothetical protein IJK05_05820 [Bacteroidales bacterium]|nr:hypothetical protein [Bacteroidales bacterium]
MKYLIRSVKYFIWFALILTITMVIMSLLGLVELNLDSMFKDGVKSVWQIAALFLVLAFVYPVSGFMKKDVLIPGEYQDIRDGVIKIMESKGYMLETEEGENMTFRFRSWAMRAFKMFEDRITLTRTPRGFHAEGLRRIVVRIVGTLEYAFMDKGQDVYSK